MRTPNKLPWKWVSVTGGWDGIADADGHVLFKMSENNPINAEFAVRCINNFEKFGKALENIEGMLVELNPSNYDTDDMAEQNQSVIIAIQTARAALKAADDR